MVEVDVAETEAITKDDTTKSARIVSIILNQ